MQNCIYRHLESLESQKLLKNYQIYILSVFFINPFMGLGVVSERFLREK